MRFEIAGGNVHFRLSAKELDEKSWYVSKTNLELIFSPNADTRWTEAVKKMGKSFEPMANFPEDPSLN